VTEVVIALVAEIKFSAPVDIPLMV